jgi:hypothetical protein
VLRLLDLPFPRRLLDLPFPRRLLDLRVFLLLLPPTLNLGGGGGNNTSIVSLTIASTVGESGAVGSIILARMIASASRLSNDSGGPSRVL